ncbi:MAG: hypothetical protein ACOYMF_18080, partial [Bacteroidales bacterium]
LVFDKQSDVFTSEGWSFNGNWENHLNWDKKNQAKYSSTKGDEISFTFEGTGVSITGNWFKNGGKADVYVDNVLQRTIDCFFYYATQELENMNIYHILGLREGKHTVKIVVKGEKRPDSQGENIYVSGATVYKTSKKANEEYKFSFQQ